MGIFDVKNAAGEVLNRIVLDDPGAWPCPPGCTLAAHAPVPEPAPAVLSQLAFLRRFTAEERIAIRASADPVVADFLHLLSLAQEIRTDDPDTVAGVGYLEVVGLLTTGRGGDVLSGGVG